jgi:diguanylate cyclase (GGDEF)-like protein
MKRNRALIVAAIAFLATVGIGAAFIRLLETRREEGRRRAAVEAATARGYALERQLDYASAAAFAASSALRQQSTREFAALASDILEQYPIIAALLLAPDGVVAATVPASAQPPRGTDLLGHPEHGEEARRAGDTRGMILGPPIARGSEGLFSHGYLPVFRPSDRAPWAWIVVSLRVRDVIEAAAVQELVNHGHDYSISRIDPESGRATLIARSTELPLRNPVQIPIDAQGAGWLLSVVPRGGWRGSEAPGREPAVAVVAGLLVALFVYDLLRRPERLEREVEIRARRLLETHRKLMDEMTQREKAEEQVIHEATHDQLTGLANRPHFLIRVGRIIDRRKINPQFGYALLVVNIDRFKTVNASLGPAVGDQLLVQLARRLEACLRPEDMVARVGGDEFAILLFDVDDVLHVIHVATRAQQEIQVPFEQEGDRIFLSASIGIALSGTGYERPEEPLRDAHLAMITAKREGGARHVIFDRAMHEHAVALSNIERELRPALERNELQVFYQAIVSLEIGQVTGFEALVRWNHPQRGFISPGAFLPVAEATGLVVAMDRWVLKEAACHVRSLNDQRSQQPFSISVNLSGKQFSDPNLVDVVQESLRQSGLSPQQLRLEITESVMMENAKSALEILRALKKLDIQISLDDFGTGYSSLSYIREFPIDFLKIDRSFVSRMTENAKDEEIVRMILVLAETLGLRVVAEGIETSQHLEHLRSLRCTYGQGYLFSKPLDSNALRQFLDTDPRW